MRHYLLPAVTYTRKYSLLLAPIGLCFVAGCIAAASESAFGRMVSCIPQFGYARISKPPFILGDIQKTVDVARARLDGVTLENLDFEEVIARYDSPEALLYCDPPYTNDCPEVRNLYNGWNIEEVTVTYSVGGKSSDRGKAREKC